MENDNKTTLTGLNALIMANYDRVEGYTHAIKESQFPDLDTLFNRYIGDSNEHIRELSEMVRTRGGEPTTKASAAGDLYRVWMDIKAAVASKDRLAVLSNCEFGEDVAVKAYKKVLENDDVELSSDVRSNIMSQYSNIKAGHDKIRDMRNAEKERAKAAK